jgi:hypothetical protein
MNNKRISIKIDMGIDLQLWALLPALNINLRSKKLKLEWLCFGVYINKIKPEVSKNIIKYEIHVSTDEEPALRAVRRLRRKILWLKMRIFFKRLFGHECS